MQFSAGQPGTPFLFTKNCPQIQKKILHFWLARVLSLADHEVRCGGTLLSHDADEHEEQCGGAGNEDARCVERHASEPPGARQSDDCGNHNKGTYRTEEEERIERKEDRGIEMNVKEAKKADKQERTEKWWEAWQKALTMMKGEGTRIWSDGIEIEAHEKEGTSEWARNRQCRSVDDK